MMMLPLNRTVLINRIAEIEADISELEKLQKLSQAKFIEEQHFAIAEHYLRRALEAVFDLSGHILSRLPLRPSDRPEGYKALAFAMSRYKIIPAEFAEDKLAKMAGYRNRLVHFYQEITKDELYGILQSDIPDLEKFISYIKELIDDPKKFDLEITE